MGKGDKKTKRGKIVIGSHGKLRPRKKGNATVTVVPKEKKEKAAKTPSVTTKKSTPKAAKK